MRTLRQALEQISITVRNQPGMLPPTVASAIQMFLQDASRAAGTMETEIEELRRRVAELEKK